MVFTLFKFNNFEILVLIYETNEKFQQILHRLYNLQFLVFSRGI